MAVLLMTSACLVSDSEVLRNVQGTPIPPVPTLDAKQVIEGKQTYATHCASCHGVNEVGTPKQTLSPPFDARMDHVRIFLKLSVDDGACIRDNFKILDE